MAVGCQELKRLPSDIREKRNGGKEGGITHRCFLPRESELSLSETAVSWLMANITFLGFFSPLL